MSNIILKTTSKVRKQFKYIDFDVLSDTSNLLLNKSFNFNSKIDFNIEIKVSAHPIEDPNSYYAWGSNTINIQPFKKYNKKYLLKHFLDNYTHEFRHWMQDKILGVDYGSNYNDEGNAYYQCPMEKDARIFAKENISSVVALYKSLVKLKNSSKRFNQYEIEFVLG